MLDVINGVPTLPRRSRSSLVRALFLTQVGAGRSLPEQFTTRDVCAALALTFPDGAVSGWVSKAVETGMLRQLGRDAERCVVLEIADLARVPPARLAPGAGSRPGRTHRGAPWLPGLEMPASSAPGSGKELSNAAAPAPTVKTDFDVLREVAAQLSALADRLEAERTVVGASTQELLVELGRRAGCGVRLVAE